MDIGWVQVVASSVLVVVAVGVSVWRGLGVERSILWAALRAAVQLLACVPVKHRYIDSAARHMGSHLGCKGNQ